MEVWLAKEKDGKIHIFQEKPFWNEAEEIWDIYGGWYIRSEKDYPQLTFTNSPRKAEVKLELT